VVNEQGVQVMIYEKELSEKIIGFAFKVYNELGNGFLEKVYENSLVYIIRKNSIICKAQVPISVYCFGVNVGQYFADILVENKIILELKVCEKISPVHEAQLLHYLKATGIKVGYILNFGHKEKLEFKRMVL